MRFGECTPVALVDVLRLTFGGLSLKTVLEVVGLLDVEGQDDIPVRGFKKEGVGEAEVVDPSAFVLVGTDLIVRVIGVMFVFRETTAPNNRGFWTL